MSALGFFIFGSLYIGVGLGYAGACVANLEEKGKTASPLSQLCWIFFWPVILVGKIAYDVLH